MKNIATLIIVAATVVSASAATDSSFTVTANQWGTIQPAGVRAPSGGTNFLNAQGSSNGQFASDAPVRFDISAAKAEFDDEFGAGNWGVKGVSVLFQQNNAFFSATGPVDMYHLSDDAVAITNGDGFFGSPPASTLRFGDILANNGVAGTNSLVTDDFLYVDAGENSNPVDEYIVAGLGLDIVAADILADDTLTFALIAGANTSATYNGSPFQGIQSPRVRIDAFLIPEPASLVLIALGALVARRR